MPCLEKIGGYKAKNIIDARCECCSAVRMIKNLSLEQAKAELVTCEIRAKALRTIVETLEAVQRKYDSLSQLADNITVRREQFGLADIVRGIISEAPEQVFSTLEIRQLLSSRGFDTKPRNFGSSLSTTLTRLGKSGFLLITTDGDGNRTYQKTKLSGNAN